MEDIAYSWYNAQTEANVIEPKKDKRVLPSPYGKGRLATCCGCVQEGIPHTECLYYKQHSYETQRKDCRYLRMDFMCDKVIGLGEKELN